MATINLFPNETLTQMSGEWVVISAASFHEALQDDDSTNYCKTGTAGTINRIGFDNMSVYHDDINSIRFVMEYRQNGRGSTSEVEVKTWIRWDDLLNNLVVDTESSGTIAASGGYNTVTFTAQTDYIDGMFSTVWSTNVINEIGVSIECDAITGGTANLTYAYLIVDYDVGGVDEVNGVGMNNIDTVNGVSPENFDTVSGVD
tara:strand:+ start:462 stop:1067 length:606 start_codon:yes stop_codon:yes gene_type:complete